MVAWHCIRLNVYTSLYVSVQDKGQQGPPNCHCVSTVPAGIGRNTQAVDKNIQWIAIILIMRSVYGQITLVRQKLRLETALNAWA